MLPLATQCNAAAEIHSRYLQNAGTGFLEPGFRVCKLYLFLHLLEGILEEGVAQNMKLLGL